MNASRSAALLSTGLASLLLLGACGSSDAGDGGSDDGKVSVVASTDVWGSVAQAIAGGDAKVTSIITSSTQDPHEYEATAQDRLALGDADVVIENGADYDPFVGRLLKDADADPATIDASKVSGLMPAGGGTEGFNEHVWYSFPTVKKVAQQISDDLGKADPDHASDYRANLQEFTGKVDDLISSVSEIKTTADGQGVAITEPVPLYLLQEAGLANRTPEAFSEAVEEGADVPPRVLQQTLALFDDDDVSVLAYNTQTEDDTTEQVKQAAESNDVPVVDFTETLPKGKDYLQWMQDNIDRLASALGAQ